MSGKVLLITPDYHCGVLESAGRWPNLGFLYVAGELRKAGFDVEIYDAMSLGHDLGRIRRRIEAVRPDHVGVTAYTSSIYAACDVLKAARDVDSNITTILGGIHSTFCYEEVLHENPCVDFVVRHEGEVTAPELLRTMETGGDLAVVKGIAFRKGNDVVVTPQRPFLADLDAVEAAWDLVDWKYYTFYILPKSRMAVLNTSRGCTEACSFCSQQKFWEQCWRARKPETVVEEVLDLNSRYGVDVFMFSDEVPTKDRARWEEILERLILARRDIHVLMETRVEDIVRDADIIGKYKKAGVLHIYVGVEAADQATVDRFKKNVKVEESYEALRIIDRAKILSETSFILGLPEETPEHVKQVLELSKYYSPDFAHYLLISPWPYADMWNEVKAYVAEPDYSKYNLIEPVIKPSAMELDELRKAMLWCYKEFYTDKMRQVCQSGDEFKRHYVLMTMKIMMKTSFLRNYMRGLGGMPEEMARVMGGAKPRAHMSSTA